MLQRNKYIKGLISTLKQALTETGQGRVEGRPSDGKGQPSLEQNPSAQSSRHPFSVTVRVITVDPSGHCKDERQDHTQELPVTVFWKYFHPFPSLEDQTIMMSLQDSLKSPSRRLQLDS